MGSIRWYVYIISDPNTTIQAKLPLKIIRCYFYPDWVQIMDPWFSWTNMLKCCVHTIVNCLIECIYCTHHSQCREWWRPDGTRSRDISSHGYWVFLLWYPSLRRERFNDDFQCVCKCAIDRCCISYSVNFIRITNWLFITVPGFHSWRPIWKRMNPSSTQMAPEIILHVLQIQGIIAGDVLNI